MLMAALARQTRLRKQRRLLREKGVKMVEKGLQDLDELEAMEQAEVATATLAPSLSVPPVGVIDWSSVGLSDLLGPDDSGGIVAEGAGNSSGGA